MARTIVQIQQSIIDAKNGINPNLPLSTGNPLSNLSSSSSVAVWLLWTYVVAVCHWALENLFDFHREEVATLLAQQKPHTLQWYVQRAKDFQFGVALPAERDTYTFLTNSPVVRIVQYAAAVEMPSLIRIKTAARTGSTLIPLTTPQLSAFTAYMQLIKDAGVRLQITSGNPDRLKLVLNIFYDPLVLDGAGTRLDGTSATPVPDAITAFLYNLPFNGLFVVNRLIAELQNIDGVVIGEVISVAATYGSLPFTAVPVEYLPDAGYMVLDPTDGLTITYTAHAPI